MNEDFKILQKAYDMRKYGEQCLKQFPKHETHVKSAEMRRSMGILMKLIIRANKKYYKKTTLEEMDIELAWLKMEIRFAADPDIRYLPIKKYEHWAKMLNELGRMLGGWIKSTK